MGKPLSQIVRELGAVRDSFGLFARTQPLFLPEERAASQILELLQGGAVDPATRARVRAVLEQPMVEHYEGSGWHELKLLVRQWLLAAEAEDLAGKH